MNPVPRRVRRSRLCRVSLHWIVLNLARLAICGALPLAGLLALDPNATLANSGHGGGAEQDGAWLFASAAGLNPPGITVLVHPPATKPAATPEYLFLAPIADFSRHEAFVGKQGPEIVETDGDPVWEDPLGQPLHIGSDTYKEVAMDFHTATYEGKPVLVWWQGHITRSGFGSGVWNVVNSHYQTIASLHAPSGYETDFHTIEFSRNGMAYFLGSKIVPDNLTKYGGSADGELFDQVVFEAEIRTGRVIWSWDPLQHIPLSDSYVGVPAEEPWDPFHLNSVGVEPDGNIVISARDTWAAYWVTRTGPTAGSIYAILGGKRSSFALGSNVHFAWQHDVTYSPGDSHLVVFADEAFPPEAEQSRGLVISLNWTAHTASLVGQYLLPHPALAGSQGSVETLPNGNVFVGWGQLPYFSEYAPSGTLLYLGSLHEADESYRTYKDPWVGQPLTKPSIAVSATAGGKAIQVAASWNGATEVASWQLLSGATPATMLATGAPVERDGFETTLFTENPGPYYAVEAIDAAGEVLSTSQPGQLPPAA